MMKMKPQNSKKKLFQLVFIAIVCLLFVIKILLPVFSGAKDSDVANTDSVAVFLARSLEKPVGLPGFFAMEPAHSIRGVSSYDTAFPDANDKQLVSARRNGIKPQQNREDITPLTKTHLEQIKSCQLYAVDNLKNSVPYLVPKARLLLSVVGRNFIDSLTRKHLPAARVLVTSVLRTIADVNKLQSTNVNSTANSCHFYGTTFDISYTRYKPLTGVDGCPMRVVRDDTLKWVLSEVLRDLRQAGTCHVKHEKKQGCFHITVK